MRTLHAHVIGAAAIALEGRRPPTNLSHKHQEKAPKGTVSM